MQEEVIVIGAGASGMMAAVTAAGEGCKVLVLEQLSQPGKKIYATGNGKCNYTNEHQSPECYRGEEPGFIRKALAHFSYRETLDTFRGMGILPQARDGYYYPVSGQAASVVDALVRRMEMLGVALHTEERVQRITDRTAKDGTVYYQVQTDKASYETRNVILAVGGKAAPVHGSKGDGYKIAEKLGLQIVSPVPALTSCVLKGDFTKEWAKIRVRGCVELYSKAGELLAKDRGELQLVSYGLSGIPCFQVSRYAARALEQGDRPYLLLDILPDYPEEELWEELSRRRKDFASYTAEQALEGMVHQILGRVLLKSLGLKPKDKAGEWSDRDIRRIADRFKHWKVGIERVNGFDFAQVTAGGVWTNQLDPDTMEVCRYPGFYITGELLDVDGICGGYNLQWAWTSGYLAGMAVANQERNAGRS